jgi:hypothetical protein
MVFRSVLNGRIYRAALIPVLFALAIAGFSLSDLPGPFTSTLAPDAFDATGTFAELQSLAASFPDRRPGSAGDMALAARISRDFHELGGTAGGGFSVRTRRVEAQTIDGARTLITVTAERPGTTAERPIVVMAHRDAAGRGAEAALSGTATLLELARVLASSETQRTIILVSTSGGSGGNAGAADFATRAPEDPDAVLVLGDLAGTITHKPFVVPFSSGFGEAPVRLGQTVSAAIGQEIGANGGVPSALEELAQRVFPFAVGEQAPLNDAGVPSVLVQVSGEGGPTGSVSVSAARLQNFGRGVLSAVYALDSGSDVPRTMQTGVVLRHKAVPEWALRLLVGALILAPLLTLADGLARLRRRREPVARWMLWTLSCSVPFLLCALFALLLGRLGAIVAPTAPVLPRALPFTGSAQEAVLAVLLVGALAWLAWFVTVRRVGLRARPSSEAAGLAVMLVLLGVSVVVWLVNPFTALLLIGALHLWLLLTSQVRHVGRVVSLAVVTIGLIPLVLLVAFYAHRFGLGVGDVAHTAVLMVAGGRIGVAGAFLWSVAFGCLVAGALFAMGSAETPNPGSGPFDDWMGEPQGVTVRGPVSYAGPGSLGGTESALRR